MKPAIIVIIALALIAAVYADCAFDQEALYKAEHEKVIQLQREIDLLSVTNAKAISTINDARVVNEDAMRRLYICEAIR